MKQKKHGILLVVGIVAMLLMPLEPCRADWMYIGSEVASGPWSGNGGDAYYEWWFLVSDIDTSADSSGASASATCEAEIMAYPESFGGTVSRSGSPWCTSWGRSGYVDPDPPNPLYVSWSLSGSGTVKVSGEIISGYMAEGDSGSSSAFAYGELESSDEYGNAYAQGSVSRGANGHAEIDVDGHATIDSSEVADGEFESYAAELNYSVSGSDSITLENETQFTARAEVQASASCSASVSVEGEPYWGRVTASSYAEASGSSSVSVSW